MNIHKSQRFWCEIHSIKFVCILFYVIWCSTWRVFFSRKTVWQPAMENVGGKICPAVLLRKNQVVSPRKSLGSQQDVAWIFSHLFSHPPKPPMIDLQKLHLNSCSKNQWQCWLCCDCYDCVGVEVGCGIAVVPTSSRISNGHWRCLISGELRIPCWGIGGIAWHSCGSCSWRCGHETAQERTGC